MYHLQSKCQGSLFFYRAEDAEFYDDQKSAFYGYWAGSVIGPFLHILAVAHVLLWGLPSSIVGSVVSCSETLII